MKKCLQNIIDKDQTGFLQNRYIEENIIRMLEIMDYTDLEDIPALAIFIDFEKTFDLLEWKFIKKVLVFFNFGKSFCDWIDTLYNNTSSQVLNNGWASEPFSISRGVRQGCPLSPYLFLICAEILAIMIRQNENIEGIKLGSLEYKVSQYADDTCLTIIADVKGFQEVITIFDRFEKISGLRINYDKTEIMPIGSLKNTQFKLKTNKKLKWTHGPVRLLGIMITTEKKDLISLNYLPLLQKVKNQLNMWSQRSFSLYGKITVIKTYALSQLIYVMSVLPSPLPQDRHDDYFKSIEDLMFNFLWNGTNKDKIKRQTLIGSYEQGGLKMVHINSQNCSLKLAWIKRLIDIDCQGKWKDLVFHQFPTLKENIWKCNINCRDVDFIFRKVNSLFWKEIVKKWCNMNFFEPKKQIDITYQYLWYNSWIRIQDRPVCYASWSKKGINKIHDLLDNNGIMLSYNGFLERFPGVNTNFLIYQGLIDAIPREWKMLFQGSQVEDTVYSYMVEKVLSAEKSTKFVYSTLIDNIFIPPNNAQSKWSEDLATLVDDEYWKTCFIQIHKCTISAKLRAFQYRFIHRIIFTNSRLFKMGKKESSLCTLCQEQEETLIHYFYECNVAKDFWRAVLSWLRVQSGCNIDFSKKKVLLGIEVVSMSFWSLIFLIAKHYMFVCHDKEKFSLEYFKIKVEEIRLCEYRIAVKNNKLKKHREKWKYLLQ